jgi:hypothetical protein
MEELMLVKEKFPDNLISEFFGEFLFLNFFFFL